MNTPLPAITELLEAHSQWRRKCLNLIASENTPSPAVEALMHNELAHRYGDYAANDPAKKKYQGNRFITQIEQACQQQARELFDCKFVDVRPLSGHIAGIAPLLALCQPGDKVMEFGKPTGGHRLTGKFDGCSAVPLKALLIPFDADQFNIDVKATLEMVEREKPRFLIVGCGGYLFPHPVQALREGIDQLGLDTVIQYDASHVLGLIAGGIFARPLADGADLITSSTHKTLAGPQGGIILSNREDIFEPTGLSLQPGLLANHHLNRIPALHQSLYEWAVGGKAIAEKTVQTAKALAKALDEKGIPMVASHLGYTESHTFLIQSQSLGSSSKIAQELEDANIVAGVIGIPKELGGEAVRFGTQELVRHGLELEDLEPMAGVIAGVIQKRIDTADAQKRVAEIVDQIYVRNGNA